MTDTAGKAKSKRKAGSERRDFVTSLSVEACQERLQQKSSGVSPDWQRVYLHDNRFTIERQMVVSDFALIRNEKPPTVRVLGTFEAVPSGTRVLATLDETTADRFMSEWTVAFVGRWAVGVFMVLFFPLAILLLSLDWLALESVPLLLLVFLTNRWRAMDGLPEQVLNWLYNCLYEPPELDAQGRGGDA